MNDSNVQRPSTPAKKGSSMLRFVLIGVLGVLLVVLGFDQYARRQAAAAHDELNEYVVTDEEDTGADFEIVTMDAVHKIVGREPTESFVHNRQPVETYLWKSPIREYSLIVLYTRGRQPAFDSSYLNQRPPELDIPEYVPKDTGPGSDGPVVEPAPGESTVPAGDATVTPSTEPTVNPADTVAE